MIIAAIIRKENQILIQRASETKNEVIYELPNCKSLNNENEIALLIEKCRKIGVEFEITDIFFEEKLEGNINIVYNTELSSYSSVVDSAVWVDSKELKNMLFTKQFEEAINKLISENELSYSVNKKLRQVIEEISKAFEMKIEYRESYNSCSVLVYNGYGVYCPYAFSINYTVEKEDDVRLMNAISITRMYAEGDKSDLYFIFANFMAIIYKYYFNQKIYIDYINLFDNTEINGASLILNEVHKHISPEKLVLVANDLYHMYVFSLILFDRFVGSFSLIRDDKKFDNKYAKYLNEDEIENFNLFSREEHQYYTSHKRVISLICINNGTYNFENFIKKHKWNLIDGVDGKILYQVDNEDESYNFVSQEDWDTVLKVVNDMSIKNYSIICQTNQLYLLEENRIWIFAGDFSEYWVEKEKEKIIQRQTAENTILHFNRNYKWKYPVDSGRFEELIADLLETDIMIDHVRLVGKSNNADGGRDLLIYKLQSQSKDKYCKKLLIGQCKAYEKSVNKSHVRDIRDTLEYYNADGFFVAVTSCITAQLIDHLCKLNDKKDVDWWTEREIFKKLRQNSYIVDRYLDILEITN